MMDRTQVLAFNLEGRDYKLDVGTDLHIDLPKFGNALMTQAALMAFYGGLYRTADRIVSRLELDFEIWEATQRNGIRERCNTEKQKLTEKAIDDQVKTILEYRVRMEQLQEAIYKRDMLRNIVDAFRDRTTMLQQIGARLRDNQQLDMHAAEEIAVKKPRRGSA
jgi:hypothetical protein